MVLRQLVLLRSHGGGSGPNLLLAGSRGDRAGGPLPGRVTDTRTYSQGIEREAPEFFVGNASDRPLANLIRTGVVRAPSATDGDGGPTRRPKAFPPRKKKVTFDLSVRITPPTQVYKKENFSTKILTRVMFLCDLCKFCKTMPAYLF